MKLLRLYANKAFHNIKFTESGLNVILGKVFNKDVKEKDTHNLGKSLLVDLLDFLLLKTIDKKFFLLNNEKFIGYEFYLEIKIANGFLLIKRDIEKPTKICFWEHSDKLQDFNINIDWTYSDIPIRRAIKMLNQYIKFNVLQDFSYRKYINYFLRQQQDYAEVFHLSKYKGKEYDWKQFLIEIFGYENTLLKQKHLLEEDIMKKKTEIQFLENRVSANGNSDETKALIDLKEQELIEKQAAANRFDLSKKDTEEHKKLIEKIDVELQNLNAEYYKAERDLERINNSLSSEIKEIDIDSLKSIFNETKTNMPESVYIQFKDLLDFNKSLSTERNKYLQEQKELISKSLPQIKNKISILQKEQSKALNFLTGTDSYNKYKELQVDIGQIQSQISELKRKFEQVNAYQNYIAKLYEEISNLNSNLQNISQETRNMLQSAKHAKIRNLFNEIIKNILNVNGIISLNVNQKGNIDFEAKIQDPNTLNITSKDKGASYRKLQCIAFDLAILLNYKDNEFFKFAYHDGALESLDDRKKMTFIEYSREICKKYDIQHIITLIDSDLPIKANGEKFMFDQDEIRLTLSDENSEGKLFTFDF